MDFTWDERKRKTNIRKHGLDFADAETAFSGATFTFEDDRFDYGEQRFITMGLLRGVVVVIAHTERDKTARIVPMRKTTKHEQELFFQSLSN
ncbi:MAG: BrnT family toxin [candidate division KSB1 bacterium]|nr:BrnT family toxin [candidate division KSB1 bacterium]MDZ7366859.1 BrnT family toxin [candidate division KSB1 bacterium]MDZ7405134.1 BrnT family toxin [candidate division KSB1 bacterium]